MPAKMAMMAMTTSNSMSVKPQRGGRWVWDNNFIGVMIKLFHWLWGVNRIVVGNLERFSRLAGGVSLQLLNPRTSPIDPRPNPRV
jgi:hypothetical protein